MHELSETHKSILDKERRCIRLASSIMLGTYHDDSLLSDLRRSLVGPFKGAGILILPFVVLIAPFGIYEAVYSYRKREKERKEIESRERNHVVPLRSLPELWGEYGLSVDQFVSEEHLIADCLSEWLAILFGESYYYSPSEIIEQFHEESKRQGKIINDMYSRGGHINMEHWRSVVVRHITQDAPMY